MEERGRLRPQTITHSFAVKLRKDGPPGWWWPAVVGTGSGWATRVVRGLAGEVGAGDLHLAEVAEEGEGDALGAEEGLGEGLDGSWGDGVDFGDDLVDGEEAAEVHLLACEVGHAAAGGLEAEDDVGFELVFGALELGVGDGFVLEAAEFGEGGGEDFGGFIGRAAGVDGECAGVAEGADLGVDGVGEALVFREWPERGASSCRRLGWN